MIPRYSREKMLNVWSDDKRLSRWFIVEALVCEAQAHLGQVPEEHASNIKQWRTRVENGETCWDKQRILEIESNIKHDVIAFLTNVAEVIGPSARFLHLGMTSSDLLDTSLSLTIREASEIILKELESLIKVLRDKAFQYKNIPMIGRSHGIFAEPITLGVKFASFCAEFLRHKQRFLLAKQDIATCSISGAVGVYGNIDPRIEQYVAEKLNLEIETVATQIIPRDRHANFISCLALIASSIERLSTEIRLLQRSEVNELLEPFGSRQKGSSAMPHKRNPVLSENLSGLARLIRSSALPALENVTLWHERDISHSSVERIILPQTTILSDFALHRLTSIVRDIEVNEKSINDNLNKSLGLYASGALLVMLVEKGMQRDLAYDIVQRLSMQAWESKTSLKKQMQEYINSTSTETSVKQLLKDISYEKIFEPQYHTQNIETIFDRLINIDRK